MGRDETTSGGTGSDEAELRKGHRERMRKRLLEGGEDAFHDYELLEYLIGLPQPRRDMKPAAKRLIAEFGTFGGVLAASPAELMRVKGIGETAAAAIKFAQAATNRKLKNDAIGQPVLGNWRAVNDYLRGTLKDEKREQFRILLLNSRNMLMSDVKLSQGTVDQAAVHIREVVALALDQKASSIILVHNHPSGDSSPSRADIVLTKSIVEACKPLSITVHDHLIVGAGEPFSMRAQGLI